MVTARRWYIFLVCAISLNVVVWSLIELLRSLFVYSDSGAGEYALPIAVIMIGLPLYAAHWWWAERTARRDPDERESLLRHVYLYGTLTGFLLPFLTNIYDLLTFLLGKAAGLPNNVLSDVYRLNATSLPNVLLYHLFPLVLLGAIGVYHWIVAQQDVRAITDREAATGVRRLFLLSFAFGGILTAAFGVISILLIILQQFGDAPLSGELLRERVVRTAVGVLLGTVVWVLTWLYHQRVFVQGDTGEQHSAVRKLYLYALIFIAVMVTVVNGVGVLGGIIQTLLGIPTDGDIREAISAVVVMATLWAYHTAVLRHDERTATEAPRQATIRRIYWYLVAAVGLSGVWGGVLGLLTTLIRMVTDGTFDNGARSAIAFAAAAVIIGIPLWLLPWRRAQAAATADTGSDERRAVVRKIYLYAFLFFATLSVLFGAIFILYRILSNALGESFDNNLFTDVAQAIAFVAVGAVVWLYHGMVLREDGRRAATDISQQASSLNVVFVEDSAAPNWSDGVLAQLRREMPGIQPTVLSGTTLTDDSVAALSTTQLIVTPWTTLLHAPTEVRTALEQNPARKVLLPLRTPGWSWAGVEPWNEIEVTKNTVAAIKQIAQGEEGRGIPRLTVGAILGLLVFGCFALVLLMVVIAQVLNVF